MITEKDLLEAIAECQGERNPNANTCIKLASYYTILNELYGTKEEPTYSYSAEPSSYRSETEFYGLIQSKSYDEVIALFDELMTAISALEPRLYQGVLRRLRG